MVQNTKKITTKQLVMMAMLIALQIILSRFLSISAWNMKIGFSFLPIALAGILFGPIHAGLVAVISDIIGAALFPTAQFLPGFTLTACIVGILYGFLHKNPSNMRILVIVLLTELIGSLFLNTLWLSQLYHTSYMVLLPTRIFRCVVNGVIEFLGIRLMAGFAPHLQRAV